MSRPLDRHRPLWEVYFIEGLEDGRVALLTKSHQILVDGVETVDIGQVLLDVGPEPQGRSDRDDWQPAPRAVPAALVAGALDATSCDPATASLTTARSNADGALARGRGLGRRVGAVADALANRRRPLGVPAQRPSCPSSAGSSRSTPTLEDYREGPREHGGTVNDVILATVTGALRAG